MRTLAFLIALLVALACRPAPPQTKAVKPIFTISNLTAWQDALRHLDKHD